jgi:protein-S-isoprenylcysteine O-methyltransferase Ste14
MTPYWASWALLAVFLASWIAAAAWAGQTVAASPARELRPLYAGGVLFFLAVGVAGAFDPALRVRLWPASAAFDWAMLALCAVGLMGCWWARLHIGRLWSGGVVVKEGHRVVDTGPYAIVRHPIYTSAFIACLAFALIRGRPLDLLLFAGFVSFFSLKARVEERFLVAQFGADYDAYRARVPMLIPGL